MRCSTTIPSKKDHSPCSVYTSCCIFGFDLLLWNLFFMNVTTQFCFCFHFMLRIMFDSITTNFNSYNECLPYNSISEIVGLGNTSIRSVQASRQIVKLVSHLTLRPLFIPFCAISFSSPNAALEAIRARAITPLRRLVSICSHIFHSSLYRAETLPYIVPSIRTTTLGIRAPPISIRRKALNVDAALFIFGDWTIPWDRKID